MEAWRIALTHRGGPVALVLSRQKLPTLDREKCAPATGVRRGAYVLADARAGAPDLILMASGSEVHLVLAAQERLSAEGVAVRVVSMASWELFRAQDAAYRETVLPSTVAARLAVEAGVGQGWREWIGDRGDVLCLDRFGASAPGERVFAELGFTVDEVCRRARALIEA